jgi:hypothetical protein
MKQPAKAMMVKRANGAFEWPRRRCRDQWIPAEKAINEVMQQVEALGTHPHLTDAVVALDAAQEAIADWAEETGNVKPE